MLSTTASCSPERGGIDQVAAAVRAAREGDPARPGVPVHRFPGSGGTMGGMAAPQVAPVETPDTDEVPVSDRQWVTIVWDDPVNLMTYVTWVFQKLFGYSREKAEKLMLDVHHKGRAVVSTGARERMEHDASQLHAYGLWATVDRS
jgi:ATP-dependent Clp protease adaptor protein ClpS